LGFSTPLHLMQQALGFYCIPMLQMLKDSPATKPTGRQRWPMARIQMRDGAPCASTPERLCHERDDPIGARSMPTERVRRPLELWAQALDCPQLTGREVDFANRAGDPRPTAWLGM
jgi:hypothetical protein